MTSPDEEIDRVARAICRERCAVYGDPPCEAPCHDDEDCRALALTAI